MENQSMEGISALEDRISLTNALASALATGSDSPVANQIKNRTRCYGFSVDNLNLLAPLGLYCELLTGNPISPLPNSPDHFLGLTNVRGNLVPVYQLEPLLDLTPLKSFYTLIFGHPANAAGLVIRKKPQPVDVTDLQENTVTETMPGILKKVISRSYTVGEREWHVINNVVLFKQLASAAY